MKFILILALATVGLSACATKDCCKDDMCPMHKSDARSVK